ncbi:MAG: tRNA uridine-5-carboxymethylaminomethyl(34) synthesis GTPase MnmE [Pseudomonadota bacterium]
MSDTICAVATVPGRAGVAVIRVSGAGAFEAAMQMCGHLPAPRELRLRRLINPETGRALDDALVVCFDAGESFTGEKVVEFHIHGSIAVQNAVISTLVKCLGVRVAEAGEFTRRAMLNGRLDLAQVEGLADLIDAETEAQQRQALRGLRGVVGRQTAAWRKALIEASALIEAEMDFADEDVPENGVRIQALLEDVASALRKQLAGARAAERIRDGVEIAILGEPNVGKSTLFNTLLARDAALTSDIPGTTRDILEGRLDIAGVPVQVLDTAGLRQSADPIEILGVQRSEERARAADMRVFLTDDGRIPKAFEGLYQEGDAVRIAKLDVGEGLACPGVSGKTGNGVEGLIDEIASRVRVMVSGASDVIRLRQQENMQQALVALESALHRLGRADPETELVGEDLRLCRRALAELIGDVAVDSVLDEIFGRFCLGK